MTTISFYQHLLRKSVVIISLALFLWMVTVVSAAAATLSLSPGTGVHTLNTTFTTRVVVNTGGDTVNAVEGALSFDADKLSVVGVSKGATFNLWTSEPSFSNSAGTISFSGGNPTGYKGSSGTVISVTFRAKTAGAAKVSFSSGAALAADGRGTNVLSNMSGGTYTVTTPSSAPEPEEVEYVARANTPSAPQVASATHTNNGWSTQTSAELTWSLPAGVTAVRTLLNDSPSSVPTKVYDTPISSIALDSLEEGVQYFHIQFQNADGWGRVTHYRLAVDTVDPTSFSVALPADADLSSPQQTFVLTGEDAGSGIVRYEVQLDGADPYEFTPDNASSSLMIDDLSPGKHTLIIEAFDAAGNSVVDSFSFTILSFDRPEFTDVPERISAGVIPVFKGVTRPGSEVEVMLQQVGTEGVVLTTVSDNEGVFSVIPPQALSIGVYDLSAVATDQYGARSEKSESVRFVVDEPGYVAIGSFMVSIMSIMVPLFALVILCALGGVYFYRRLRKLVRGVGVETAEALSIIEEQFAAITTLLHTEADTVAGTRKSNKLTKAEQQLVTVLESAIADARKTIKKEVEDVDDVIE